MTIFSELPVLEDVLPRLGPASRKDSKIVASCPVCKSPRRLTITLQNDYLATVGESECGCTQDDVLSALDLSTPELRIEEPPSLRDMEDELPIVWRVEREIFGADFDRAAVVVRHARLTKRDLVYTPDGGWLLWSGTIWEHVGEGAIRAIVAEVGDRVKREAITVSQEAIQVADSNDLLASQLRAEAERLYKAAHSLRTAKVVDGIVRSMQSLPGVGIGSSRGEPAPSITDFDQNKDILGFTNGVVDLRTGELRPYRREDKITKRSPFDYNPGASAPKRWLRFLDEVFVGEDDETDPEIVDFMKRLLGYSITGHTKEEIFAVLYGGGGNGKSKLTEMLDDILGDHCITTPFETFEAKSRGSGVPVDIAAMRGARVVLASEGNAGASMNEGVLKRLTGQDSITARELYGKLFTFRPNFLLLLSTNAKPAFRGQDEGLWRRVVLVPFRHEFKRGVDRDEGLIEKLKAERDGIILWLVEGVVEWYRDGLKIPDAIRAEVDIFRAESDRLGEFLEDVVVKVEDHSLTIKRSELYPKYREWAANVNDDHPLGRTLFYQQMRAGRLTEGASPKGEKVYRGVRWKKPSD